MVSNTPTTPARTGTRKTPPLSTDTAIHVTHLWDDYEAADRREGSPEEEALVRAYLPLVFRVRDRVMYRFPPNVEADDITQNGLIGLIASVREYEPAQGKFEGWAMHTIEFRIMDGQRSSDWLPRQRRTNVKRVHEALGALRTAGHHIPTDAQIATATHLSVKAVQDALEDYASAYVHSLDDLTAGSSDSLGEAHPLHSDGHHHVEFDLRDFLEHAPLFDAIRSLDNDREKQILALYYFGRHEYKEIAEIFSISVSRVSQIVKVSVGRLRLSMMMALTA